MRLIKEILNVFDVVKPLGDCAECCYQIISVCASTEKQGYAKIMPTSLNASLKKRL
jgi:hypothetical protein